MAKMICKKCHGSKIGPMICSDKCTECYGEGTQDYRTKEENEKVTVYAGEKLKPGESPRTEAGWIAFAEAFHQHYGIYSDERGRLSGIIGQLLEIIKFQEKRLLEEMTDYDD